MPRNNFHALKMHAVEYILCSGEYYNCMPVMHACMQLGTSLHGHRYNYLNN